jgi:hypothetical protein
MVPTPAESPIPSGCTVHDGCDRAARGGFTRLGDWTRNRPEGVRSSVSLGAVQVVTVTVAHPRFPPVPIDFPPAVSHSEDMSNRNANVIDMNTAEGCAAWMKGLPTENLRSIAARPLDVMNALLVMSAEAELIVRGEQ